MKLNIFTVLTALLLIAPQMAMDAREALAEGLDKPRSKELREALRLHDYGMYSRSRYDFDQLARKTGAADPEGYAILNDVLLNVPGYVRGMESFFEQNPHSVLVPKIRYAHALNLFDAQEYRKALVEFSLLKPSLIYKSQRPEYLFKKGYSRLENDDMKGALADFKAVESMKFSDYTAPARYAIGYINYELKDFAEALKWFGESVKDGRVQFLHHGMSLHARRP